VSAEAALAAEVKARLRAEPELEPWLGAPARVLDADPAQPTYPYVTLSRSQSRPGAIEGLTVHTLTLTCVSRHGGAEEARLVTAALRRTVDGAALTLAGHRLVSLGAVYCDAFRAGDKKSVLGLLRLRAVTEALS